MTMLPLTPFFKALARALATARLVKLYVAIAISSLADWTRLRMACSMPPSGENRAWTGNLLTLAMNGRGLMKLVKCATRSLKKKRIFQKHAFYKAAQLFKGTVHFVNVSFGTVTVSDADYKTAVAYATLAAVPISQYCGQYGPNSLTIDPTVYTG